MIKSKIINKIKKLKASGLDKEALSAAKTAGDMIFVADGIDGPAEVYSPDTAEEAAEAYAENAETDPDMDEVCINVWPRYRVGDIYVDDMSECSRHIVRL